MRILVIDNYDSFTYNLCHLAAQVTGSFPIVRRNDEVTLAEVVELDPELVILSPGPGHPATQRDFGICAEILRSLTIPVLGVCLGHQGIGQFGGAAVVPAARVMHGLSSRIFHHGSGLFSGIPQGFSGVRYHSFVIATPMPDTIERLAWTEAGEVMAMRHRERPFWGVQFHPESIATEYGARLLSNFFRCARQKRHATVRRFDCYVEPERAFCLLFANDQHSFWLDSSAYDADQGRFSFIGGSSAPGSFAIKYPSPGETLFDYLRRELKEREIENSGTRFCGGFVGYFGFELKGECGYSNSHTSDVPDAQLLYASAVLTFDHELRSMQLVLAETSCELGRWADDLETRLRGLVDELLPEPEPEAIPPFRLRHDEETYRERVKAAQVEIAKGESYEICLTDIFSSAPINNPLSFYRRLRRVNPSHYSAFLRFGEISVACSSPERFLRIDSDRVVTSKPIKGTAARGADEAEDEQKRQGLLASTKDAAEHLMIVDLVRNDLGRVCEPGSVSVPVFRGIESYSKVHQLVSTVQGRLSPEKDVIDCLRAAFPAGSMTGAPKARTLEILDRLEAGPRGVYSGSIGYLGLDGRCDLNIVIRSAIVTSDRTEIGSGGAIVAMSDAEAERRELELKVSPLLDLLTNSRTTPAVSSAPRQE